MIKAQKQELQESNETTVAQKQKITGMQNMLKGEVEMTTKIYKQIKELLDFASAFA